MKALKTGLLVLIALFVVAIWAFVGMNQFKKDRNPLPRQSVIEATPLVSDSPITTIPLNISVNVQKALLGKKLFFEPRLSRDNSINCASCHSLSSGGMDNKRYSKGVAGATTVVNTPTIFNTSLQFRQYWNGRATTLEEQAISVVSTHGQMKSDWPIAIAKLKTDASYTKDFGQIYADGITRSNVADAIAEFERTLITPNSRFDKFLRGVENSITSEEKQGYENFKRYGCVSCHQGMLLGGNMFERMGSVRDYFAVRGNIQPIDLGYYNVTHQEKHRYYFKVSSLRNVEKTAPYFHDGSAATLEDAVRVMAKYNLGITISNDDVKSIVAFLKTLTGEYQGNPL
jgi:cytochrome c peroxidase